ncbi:MAG: hypothetical protein KIT84_36320 [Labilithrix sp.]|nr:hypothetical protein [Labilithrix sp.]MCW5816521.1 hypothetical protein [Labilithrix sp.]
MPARRPAPAGNPLGAPRPIAAARPAGAPPIARTPISPARAPAGGSAAPRPPPNATSRAPVPRQPAMTGPQPRPPGARPPPLPPPSSRKPQLPPAELPEPDDDATSLMNRARIDGLMRQAPARTARPQVDVVPPGQRSGNERTATAILPEGARPPPVPARGTNTSGGFSRAPAPGPGQSYSRVPAPAPGQSYSRAPGQSHARAPAPGHARAPAPGPDQSYAPGQSHARAPAPGPDQSYAPGQSHARAPAPGSDQSYAPGQSHARAPAPGSDQSYAPGPGQSYARAPAPGPGQSYSRVPGQSYSRAPQERAMPEPQRRAPSERPPQERALPESVGAIALPRPPVQAVPAQRTTRSTARNMQGATSQAPVPSLDDLVPQRRSDRPTFGRAPSQRPPTSHRSVPPRERPRFADRTPEARPPGYGLPQPDSLGRLPAPRYDPPAEIPFPSPSQLPPGPDETQAMMRGPYASSPGEYYPQGNTAPLPRNFAPPPAADTFRDQRDPNEYYPHLHAQQMQQQARAASVQPQPPPHAPPPGYPAPSSPLHPMHLHAQAAHVQVRSVPPTPLRLPSTMPAAGPVPVGAAIATAAFPSIEAPVEAPSVFGLFLFAAPLAIGTLAVAALALM